MAPIEQYLMASAAEEIALARSAAPAVIADDAEVLTLGESRLRNGGEGQEWLCLPGRAVLGGRL